LENELITTPESTWVCTNCGCENKLEYRFCRRCGKPRFALSAEFGKKSVYSVMALYFLLLFGIIFIWFMEPGGSGWRGEFYASIILAVITLVFVFFDFRDFIGYIFPKKMRWRLLAIIFLLAPIFSFLVSNVVNWVNRTLFDVYDMGLRTQDAPNPLLFAILFTAVFPGIFEELAFRGVIFNRGRGIFSLKQTILVSSVLFTFLHLSYLSFIWIFPFALILGWLRAKYRTTFYGMCVHFLHNFTAVMLEYYHWDKFL